VALRKALYPLLFAFALLSSQITIAYILFVPLVAIWLVTGWRLESVRRALAHPLTALAGVFALLVTLSVVFSRDPRASFRAVPGLSLFLLIPITLDLVDTVRRARAVLLAVAASGTGMALFGLAQLARRGPDLQNRIHANLSHYMTLSGLTLLAGCILLAFLFEGRGRERWWSAAAIIPFSAMIFTLTRGAYVGAVAAVTAYLALRRPRGLLLVVPALLAVFLLLPPDVRHRALSIADPTDRTNLDRIAMARAGARMIADFPILGIGPELVKPYYTLYRDPDAPRWRVPHLHDNVIQIAAASGVFAAAAYLALLALFFARVAAVLRGSDRAADSDRALIAGAAFLAVAAGSVAGLFEYNFGDKEVLMATLPLLALPFARGMRREAAESSQPIREPVRFPGTAAAARRIQS
jgi:putative inorganic carbon (hco3(-)) transporter